MRLVRPESCRRVRHLVLVLILLLCAGAGNAAAAAIEWVEGADGPDAVRVNLWFFWSEHCPHCREALPFVASLQRDHPWLRVHSHELSSSREHVARYVALAAALGQEARAVPAFFVCGRMFTGYDRPEGMGQAVLDAARLCRDRTATPATTVRGGAVAGGATAAPQVLRLPVFGEVDARTVSLPLFTLVIAGLDAFNPCAFFVLLFLLSLLVHARSRARMLLIGGSFVLVSGLIYFLFMAAWLNLFLVIGGAPVVTLAAGLVAVLIGLLNTKDWFYFRAGPSLSIPASAKPGLFRRMRGLLAADRLTALLLGTVTLAVAANSYELLCTAGFPMVYTRVLTLNGLDGAARYGYLLFYNLVYVVPLLVIVGLFTATLGARKLTERQGRFLKLVSGLMMLGLGLVMLFAPDLLNRLWVGAALLAGSLLLAYLLHRIEAHRQAPVNPS